SISTKRKMPRNLDWDPFYEVAALDLSYAEKLDRYAAIAEKRFEKDRFEAFCANHLGHLDEVIYEYFGTDHWKDTIRKKVASLFPEREVEAFTELFWDRTQTWRRDAEAKA
ncbi:MAG: hypothetical protein AAFZ18_09885, partial [Myxococcota bacterium]